MGSTSLSPNSLSSAHLSLVETQSGVILWPKQIRLRWFSPTILTTKQTPMPEAPNIPLHPQAFMIPGLEASQCTDWYERQVFASLDPVHSIALRR